MGKRVREFARGECCAEWFSDDVEEVNTPAIARATFGFLMPDYLSGCYSIRAAPARRG